MSNDVSLPEAVEAIIQRICEEKNQPPLKQYARKMLAEIGEQASLRLLRTILSAGDIQSFGGFVSHLVKKDYPDQAASVLSVYGSPSDRGVVPYGSRDLGFSAYKSENAQSKELLVVERELSESYEAKTKQLQEDLSALRGEVSIVQASMLEALSAKHAEVESLVSSMGALRKQAAWSEGKLASLQENMEYMMRNRELTETRMAQALKEELSAAERRAEDERSAHNATKLAAREREVELEQRAIEASSALARTQKTADDRASRVAELEQKVALLEVECASKKQELQDMLVSAANKRSPLKMLIKQFSLLRGKPAATRSSRR